MLFFARGHRLTVDNWFYHGTPIRLSNDQAILSRLGEINASRSVSRVQDMCITSSDVLYARVGRAVSSRGGREYIECSLRARHQRDIVELAFGNAIVGIANGGNAGSFAIFRSAEATFEGRCVFHMGNSSVEGIFDGGSFSWARSEPLLIRERPVGEVSLSTASGLIRLGLAFPPRSEEGWGVPKVKVKQGVTQIGQIIKSLNPVFVKGYSPKLWFQDEVPVFYPDQSTSLTGTTWRAILTAIFGTWFCYRPLRISVAGG